MSRARLAWRSGTRRLAVSAAGVLVLALLTGVGQASATSTGFPATGTLPSATLDSVAVNGNTATLTWNDELNNEDGFVIYRRDPVSGILTNAGEISRDEPIPAQFRSVVPINSAVRTCFLVLNYLDVDAGYFEALSNQMCTGLEAPMVSLPVVVGNGIQINWADGSGTEAGFKVYRRSASSPYTWTSVGTLATADTAGRGGAYTMFDSSPVPTGSFQDQCYLVGAYEQSGGFESYAATTCVPHILPSGPVLSPARFPLQTMSESVDVRWADRSNNEIYFDVQKRNADDEWYNAYTVASRNTIGAGVDREQYMWTDTNTSQSGQCYRIVARNTNGGAGTTDEMCTVRPDQSRFPALIGGAAMQWSGFTNTDGGTGRLFNRNANAGLAPGDQTFGVNLNWLSGSVQWQFLAKGGTGSVLMMGQALAIRVPDGSYLKYGGQTWGVDVQLSDTPSYEWYVVGDSGDTSEDPHAGQKPQFGGDHALWNDRAHAYLVNGHQTFGIDLNWYTVNGSVDPPTPPPMPQRGVKTYRVHNCDWQGHSMHVWIRDATAGGGWVDKGSLAASSPGSCRAAGTDSITFMPANGHWYSVVATDNQRAGCPSHDPINLACKAMETGFLGDTSGLTVFDAIGVPRIIAA